MIYPQVWLNGQILPLSEARVSVLDRGFLFGDGVYELIPYHWRQPLHRQAHFDRFSNSLEGIALTTADNPALWVTIIDALLAANELADHAWVYLQVTRGADTKRDHGFPTDTPPTVFAMCGDIAPPAEPLGRAASLLPDLRWQRCDLKSIALLGNILARQGAIDTGAHEAILHRDGFVTEGAASNVFAVIGGQLVTPPLDSSVLPGITRQIILDLAAANGITCEERPIGVEAFKTASEIWVTSSTREIVPITQLDGRPLADGQPGPIWTQMNSLFQSHKREHCSPA